MSPIEISGLPLVRAINGESPTKSKQLGLVLLWPSSADEPATSFCLPDKLDFDHPIIVV
jgi:hypothetical protein